MSTPEISRLTERDKPSFVALMSRAFARDPLFLYVFGDSEHDAKSRSRVTSFISFLFDKSFLLPEEVWGIVENNRLLGAYVVEKPHASKRQHVIGGLLLIWRLLPLCIRLSGHTLRLLNSYMRVTKSAAPPMPHHYLIMIGVDPEVQGKGIGKALLQHLLNTANTDEKSQGVALDTENKDNVSVYRRFGFALSKETQLDGLPIYCMFYQKDNGCCGG